MPRKRQKNKRQRITTASLQEHQDEQSEEERLGVFAPSSPTSPTSPTLPISPTSILPTKDDEQFQIAPDDSDIDEASQKQARVITVNRNNAKGKRRATKQDMQYRYDQKRMDEANEFVKTFNETTLHQVDNAAISQEYIKALEALKCDLVAEFRSTILSSMPIMAVAFFTFANSAFGVPNLFSAANRSLKDIVTKYSNLVLSNSNQLSLLTDKEYGAQLKKEVIELLSNDDHTRLLLCADGQFDAYLNQLITNIFKDRKHKLKKKVSSSGIAVSSIASPSSMSSSAAPPNAVPPSTVSSSTASSSTVSSSTVSSTTASSSTASSSTASSSSVLRSRKRARQGPHDTSSKAQKLSRLFQRQERLQKMIDEQPSGSNAQYIYVNALRKVEAMIDVLLLEN